MSTRVDAHEPYRTESMLNIPWNRVHWRNSLFLIGTLFLTLTAVPLYLWHYGLSVFQAFLFLFFFAATGLSITLGYHRLFTHRAFQAAWPVRFFTLVFGAAAFEHSALSWAADHRRHHKFVDEEDDPYDITRGFFHAHIGWLLFKLKPDAPLDYVNDLQRDPLVRWQHRHYLPIALTTGFVLPSLAGFLWGGWAAALGAFLLAGIARTVFVQQMTFFINSLCHTIGRQPYSNRCTARDSGLMALFTFGEGYHNFHHAFQHDYRNGVKPWQFDPTKWTIWILHRLGLARQLRRVPQERILLAEITEQQRRLSSVLEARPHSIAEPIRVRLQAAQTTLQQAFAHWEQLEAEQARAIGRQIEASRERLNELRREFQQARIRFHAATRHWKETYRLVQEHFTRPHLAGDSQSS
jgi:stearoyl-CoA desaturase (Delta-9 desaturase)